MKTFLVCRLVIVSISVAGYGLGFTATAAPLKYNCKSDNGQLTLSIQDGVIDAVILNTSGVQEAKGKLTCRGPQESSYLCSGWLKSDGEKVFVQLTVPVTVFQGFGGVVQWKGNDYRCVMSR